MEEKSHYQISGLEEEAQLLDVTLKCGSENVELIHLNVMLCTSVVRKRKEGNETQCSVRGSKRGADDPQECEKMEASAVTILVRFPESAHHIVTDKIERCRLSDTEAYTRVHEKSSWYGVVD